MTKTKCANSRILVGFETELRDGYAERQGLLMAFKINFLLRYANMVISYMSRISNVLVKPK
ncbi:MAG: hypothetical protein A3J24_00900 [Deltaproteobacteria bacterium RIFCSPLOWO2_02_FULL_53_8]|nr:MAG: hypothetical protein A3J24_00900 [Deltaproteobacteria bacterium RIFCSPLOWO2_02_FULL_53_8]